MTCLSKWCTPTATTKVKKDYWWRLCRVPTSVLLSPNFIQSCYLDDFLHKFAQFSSPLTTHIKMNEPYQSTESKVNIMMMFLYVHPEMWIGYVKSGCWRPLGTWSRWPSWPSLFDSTPGKQQNWTCWQASLRRLDRVRRVFFFQNTQQVSYINGLVHMMSMLYGKRPFVHNVWAIFSFSSTNVMPLALVLRVRFSYVPIWFSIIHRYLSQIPLPPQPPHVHVSA
jgi:hypothetical protein